VLHIFAEKFANYEESSWDILSPLVFFCFVFFLFFFFVIEIINVSVATSEMIDIFCLKMKVPKNGICCTVVVLKQVVEG